MSEFETKEPDIPLPKYPNRMGVYSYKGTFGVINDGSRPSWSEEHKTWIYSFDYGLGGASLGYIRESDIRVKKK
jgi:hypothetical protein